MQRSLGVRYFPKNVQFITFFAVYKINWQIYLFRALTSYGEYMVASPKEYAENCACTKQQHRKDKLPGQLIRRSWV